VKRILRLIALAAAGVHANSGEQPRDLQSPEAAFIKAMPGDTIRGAATFHSNGFQINAGMLKELGTEKAAEGKFKPTDKEMRVLTVEAPRMFKLGIENGRDGVSMGGGVTLFQRSTGLPMLSVGDADGDGRIDTLSYSVFDVRNERILEVIDYEADGQPDMRVHLREGYFEIWQVDRWFRVETRDDRPGIVINGRFVPLQRDPRNHWVVPAE
jgi:hypothetical protein